MIELIVSLAQDKGKKHVKKLLEGEWQAVYLITETPINVLEAKHHRNIVVDLTQPLENVITALKKELQDYVTGPEVAVNMFSGSGKLHMAMVSALLQLGLSVRLQAVTPEGIKEI